MPKRPELNDRGDDGVFDPFSDWPTNRARKPKRHRISVPAPELSENHLRAVEAVVTRGVDESFESIAQRAGISRQSLWRYFNDPRFVKAVHERLDRYLDSEYSAVCRQLMKGVLRDGKENLQYIRLYLELTGRLKMGGGSAAVSARITKDGIEMQAGAQSGSEGMGGEIPFDLLSVETRRKVLEEIRIAQAQGRLKEIAGEVEGELLVKELEEEIDGES